MGSNRVILTLGRVKDKERPYFYRVQSRISSSKHVEWTSVLAEFTLVAAFRKTFRMWWRERGFTQYRIVKVYRDRA